VCTLCPSRTRCVRSGLLFLAKGKTRTRSASEGGGKERQISPGFCYSSSPLRYDVLVVRVAAGVIAVRKGGKSELEKSKGKQKDEGQMKGKRKKAPSCASYSRVLWSFARLEVSHASWVVPRAMGSSEASHASWDRLRPSRAPWGRLGRPARLGVV